MKKAYRVKRTISMKQFISEFGENFSKHMKQRLLELGTRCVLIRTEESYRLDLKHVEHIMYSGDDNALEDPSLCKKEYLYGQFIVNEGIIYFSEACSENADTMQAPVVSAVYNALDKESTVVGGRFSAKEINDENIDFMIDSILAVCPEVSAAHLAIIAKY